MAMHPELRHYLALVERLDAHFQKYPDDEIVFDARCQDTGLSYRAMAGKIYRSVSSIRQRMARVYEVLDLDDPEVQTSTELRTLALGKIYILRLHRREHGGGQAREPV